MMEIKNQGDEAPGQVNGGLTATQNSNVSIPVRTADSVIMDLLIELQKLSIDELEGLWPEMLEAMGTQASEKSQALVKKAIELTIEQKKERQQATA